MKQRVIASIGILCSILFVQVIISVHSQRHSAHAAPQEQNLVQYVNPFVGTDNSTAPMTGTTWLGTSGETFPGADAPFGMVQSGYF